MKKSIILLLAVITMNSAFSQDKDSVLKANMSYKDWFGEEITVENIFLFANIKASYQQYDIAVDFLSNLLLNLPGFSEKQKERAHYQGPIDSLSILTIRGYCFTQLDFHEEAIRDYELCLDIHRRNDPILKNYEKGDSKLDSLYYWDLIGDSYSAMDKYEEALDIYNRILKSSPKNERSLQSKAECLILTGDYDKALKTINKGIKNYPKNLVYYKIKAEILIWLNEKEEACQQLQMALKIDYFSKGEYHQGYFDPVIPEIKKMIRENCE